MTKRQVKAEVTEIEAILSDDDDFLRTAVRAAIQSALEAEMTEALAAERSERVGSRLGYRSGFYSRSLITRVGTIELRVPRDRAGLFSTELFERYQRSERALVSALAEMYVQGVSTRKVKAVTEQLCGHSFSASSVSEMNKTLDAALTAFATRRLDEPYPYLILDARYERAREGGVIASQAALIAIAVAGDGHRQVLAVDLGQPGKCVELARLLAGTEAARPARRGVRGLGRSSRSEAGDPRGAARSRVATLLRAFSAECDGSSAAAGERRLSAGTALDLRPSRDRRSAARPRRMAVEVEQQIRPAL